eukprot:TRINITY_DN10022_c0_g1_i1.p1 TRINITY_DN10022_c0_g1~~TRINITY_DN10022_c0_g1_i1.p1  ORF type:complete len:529 (-),score=113.91 TRINITY_DN10022_c0_g1_i1:79-1665(-)
MSSLEEYVAKAQATFQTLDTEEKTMVFGAALCVVLLLGWILRKIFGGSRGLPSEEQALKAVGPVVTVVLQRPGSERLGMSLRPNEEGSSTIQSIAEGALLDGWNRMQSSEVRRIRNGDKIISVTSNGTSCSSGGAMTDKLKEGGDVTLSVALVRSPEELKNLGQLVSGMVVLEGLVLKNEATFRAPSLTSAGAFDRYAVEVASLGNALTAWNDARRSEGSCSTQQIEVGDRLVCVNASTNVPSALATPTPSIVLARWREPGTCSVDSFDATIQKQGADDKMGIVISPHPMAHGPALVMKILDTGAVARWNGSGNRPILKGDSIVSVNGRTSYNEIQRELGSPAPQIRIERWMATGAAAPTSGFGSGYSGAPFGAAPFTAAAGAAAPFAAPGQAAKMPVPVPMPAPSSSSSGGGGGMSLLPWRGISLVMFLLVYLLDEGEGKTSKACFYAALKLNQMLKMASKQVLNDSQGSVAAALLASAALLTLNFVWAEAMAEKRKSLLWQVMLAAVASVLYGYGYWFLISWANIV